MNLLLRATMAAALLMSLAVTPATAQNYRGALTIDGGGIWFSDFNRGDPGRGLILNEDGTPFVGGADLTERGGWLTGAQLEYWPFSKGFLQRVGIRANGNYTEQPLQVTFKDAVAANFFGLTREQKLSFQDVNTWLVDGDLLIRILRPGASRVWAPFINLGAGVAIYAPAGDGVLAINEANAFIGENGVTFITAPNDSAVLIEPNDGGNNRTKFANVFGLGTDILPGWSLGNFGVGIRLEAADHIAWRSPAEPIVGGGNFSAVHNLRFTAGIMGTFGRMFPEQRVAIVAPPAPPPAPAEESITVCVVNPNTDELQMVPAIYIPSRRDTMVSVNGQRMEFDDVFPSRAPLYVANADWYRAGRPLSLTANGHTTEWVSYGGPRAIDASDLALLGTLNGTPVYAAREEVAEIRSDLDRLHQAENQRDLAAIARDYSRLRDEIAELDVVYVPLEPGCVFQPMRRAEEVRKVRG